MEKMTSSLRLKDQIKEGTGVSVWKTCLKLTSLEHPFHLPSQNLLQKAEIGQPKEFIPHHLHQEKPEVPRQLKLMRDLGRKLDLLHPCGPKLTSLILADSH